MAIVGLGLHKGESTFKYDPVKSKDDHKSPLRFFHFSMGLTEKNLYKVINS